jgi:glutamate/tyrosine decarboxylase-like PLP-dependent enzyme
VLDAMALRHLLHPDHAADYGSALTDGLAHLLDRLGAVSGPSTGTTADEAAARVGAVDLDSPLADAPAALAEIGELWLDDAVWFHEPAYAAHLNCPVVIPALLAELYVAAVNSSLDTFDQSVGATFMERRLVDWTAARIGFPADARDGVFTSGGSQSNLQAMLLARGLATGGPSRPTLDRLRVLVSADGHFSVQKSARLLGLAEDAVVAVPVDGARRMDVAALGRALAGCVAEGHVPMAVVATAGTTDFGAIDPLPAIADVCRTYDTWLHVDAAYGGGLLVAPRHGHRLAGIDRADSVTVDYHKTWFQPVSSSALIVRDRATLTPARWHADYLNPEGSTDPNQVDKSLQTTRRFDALKLWLTLRIMGPRLIGEYVDAVVDLTREVHEALLDADDLELAALPQLSTLVLRYRPDGLTEPELAALNDRIRGSLYASGTAMVAATTVAGRRFLKLTLLNPMATRADVLGVVARIREAGADLHEPALAGGAR